MCLLDSSCSVGFDMIDIMEEELIISWEDMRS